MGVRFAPSPTGVFHVGNLRTAWISHQWSQKLKLPWVVRFEDIDQPRVIKGSQEKQLADMKSLGLVPDRVYLQSQNRKRHWNLFEKIVKDFNREDNEFCVTYSKEDFKSEPVKNNIDFWHRNVGECCYNYDPLVINPDYYGHSSAVNFDNYHTKKSKDSRLEIRAFGNTNYHKKLDKVLKHTDEIIKVYLQSQKVKLHIK
jgi:hypothetical protein